MIRLNDAETKKPIGTITYTQWRLLMNREEFDSEGSYYLNAATLDWLEQNAADVSLVRLLRDALGNQDAIEIGWVRAMLRVVPTVWDDAADSLVPVVFEILDGEHKVAEIDSRSSVSVLTIHGKQYEAHVEVGRMTFNAFVLTTDQREVARAERRSAFSRKWFIEREGSQYTLEGEWGTDISLMEGSTPIAMLSRDGEGVKLDSPDTLPLPITTFVVWVYLHRGNR